MRLVKAEGAGSGNDLSHISLPSVICVKVKQCPEVFDLCLVESKVLFDNRLCPDLLMLILKDLFAIDTHT